MYSQTISPVRGSTSTAREVSKLEISIGSLRGAACRCSPLSKTRTLPLSRTRAQCWWPSRCSGPHLQTMSPLRRSTRAIVLKCRNGEEDVAVRKDVDRVRVSPHHAVGQGALHVPVDVEVLVALPFPEHLAPAVDLRTPTPRMLPFSSVPGTPPLMRRCRSRGISTNRSTTTFPFGRHAKSWWSMGSSYRHTSRPSQSTSTSSVALPPSSAIAPSPRPSHIRFPLGRSLPWTPGGFSISQ